MDTDNRDTDHGHYGKGPITEKKRTREKEKEKNKEHRPLQPGSDNGHILSIVFKKGTTLSTHRLNPFYPDLTKQAMRFEDQHNYHDYKRKHISQTASREQWVQVAGSNILKDAQDYSSYDCATD